MSDHQETAYSVYHEWKAWSDKSFGIASVELHAAYADLLRKHTHMTGGVAIDFGFGNGEMLATLRECGFRAIGIERNSYLRDIAVGNGYEITESLADDRLLPAGSVVVVTALHVLEHLDKNNFRQTLGRFAELLQSGGVVLAAFPNGDSPFAASAFNGDITHVTWIGSSMAEQVGAMSGLKLTAFYAFPSLTTYSPRPLVRFKGLLRRSAEQLISGFISRVYYGGAGKVLAPVAVAVWSKA
jgi:2-polyprenyl-3-methyl-5-hydroxy-6-metoxy-1,4-benzoquinol methylase